MRSGSEKILYIEVPNEMMLERVEKGIKCVYQQEAKIIVGVDSNPNSLAMCANTKFIPVVLGSRTNQQDTAATSSYFKPNHSEVIHQDKQIRLLETEQWIQHYMEE